MITAIFATDIVGGMGKNLRMPWPRLDQDLSWFKSITVQCTVIMGARTWLSTDMPKPLPKRTNVVWTRRNAADLALPQSVITVTGDPENCISQLQQLNLPRQLFVIGGAQTLAHWMPYCHRVYWTQIQAQFDCDTVFAPSQWQHDFCCEGRTQHRQDQLNYEITTWNRKL